MLHMRPLAIIVLLNAIVALVRGALIPQKDNCNSDLESSSACLENNHQNTLIEEFKNEMRIMENLNEKLTNTLNRTKPNQVMLASLKKKEKVKKSGGFAPPDSTKKLSNLQSEIKKLKDDIAAIRDSSTISEEDRLRLSALETSLEFLQKRLNDEDRQTDQEIAELEALVEALVATVNILRKDSRSLKKELLFWRLRDGMLDNHLEKNPKVANLFDEIYTSDKEMFIELIDEVISDVYGRIDTENIVEQVRSLGYTPQLIYGFKAVFENMERGGDLEEYKTVFQLANYIKEVMEKKSRLSTPEENSILENLKCSIPQSVKFKVFPSEACKAYIAHLKYYAHLMQLFD